MTETAAVTAAQVATEVVNVRDLRVRYGEMLAVDGVSLTINQGEIFGILGPNGAGKTTTVECIGGLRRPDGGSISVLGMDVLSQRNELHERVGIQLQQSELPEKLRVAEALDLFASFYPNPEDPERLMNSLGLDEKWDTRFSNLSGGQRQRLSIALALIGRPQLAILDELTTGLDPQSRRETWKLIEGIRDNGVTVILVTHFMEEAEHLCDRVALLHHGHVITTDTPAALAAGTGERISFRPSTELDLELLRALPEVRSAHAEGELVIVEGSGDLTAAVIATLVRAGVVPEQTRIDKSTLDDAFLALTTDADAHRPEVLTTSQEVSA